MGSVCQPRGHKQKSYLLNKTRGAEMRSIEAQYNLDPTTLEKNMSTQNAINANDVDKLGVLLAQISDLSKQADAIKASLKAQGVGVTEGALFRAVVVEQEKTTYDMEIMRLGAPAEVLALAKRESVAMMVRVTGRKA